MCSLQVKCEHKKGQAGFEAVAQDLPALFLKGSHSYNIYIYIKT